MKSFLKLAGIFFSILLLSAALAPAVFRMQSHPAATNAFEALQSVFGFSYPFKFERIFNRFVMIFTLAAAVIFVRFRHDTWEKYGLRWRGDSLKLWAASFGIAFGVLLCLSGVRVALTDAVWALPAEPGTYFLSKIAKAFFAALLIGVMEEFFFRGFVFLNLKDRFRLGFWGSLAATNLFYSLIHFVDAKRPYIDDSPDFTDSLSLIRAPLEGYLQIDQFWMGVVGLLLFGIILNLLVVRAGSLYPAIGMHAGSVFFIKTDGLFLNTMSQGNPWFGSDQFYDGILGWVFILVLGTLLFFVVKSTVNKERT